METLTTFNDNELIAEIERRRKDLVVVPRDPSQLMCLRGAQEGSVFYDHEYDVVYDYLIDGNNLPHVDGVFEGDSYCGWDNKLHFIIAAVWRGCIHGLHEQQCFYEDDHPKFGQHENFETRYTTKEYLNFRQFWCKPVVSPMLQDHDLKDILKKEKQ